VKIKECE